MNDVLSPIEENIQMKLDLGVNAQLYGIPDCGHWPHIIYPEKIYKCIMDFVNKTEEGRLNVSKEAC